jgi:hypothetical protein
MDVSFCPVFPFPLNLITQELGYWSKRLKYKVGKLIDLFEEFCSAQSAQMLANR